MQKKFLLFIILVEFYLFATFFLFAFGPIKWNINNFMQLILFVLISYLFLGFGYGIQYKKLKSIQFTKQIRAKNSSININSFNMQKEIKIIYYLSSIFAVFASLVMNIHIHGGLNVKNIFLNGLGYLYFFALDNMLLRENNVLVQIITLAKGLSYFYLPIGIMNWNKLTRMMKITGFLAIALDIIYWLNLGTLKGVGDVIICLLSFLCIKLLFHMNDQDKLYKMNYKFLKNILIIFFVITIFIIMFSFGQADRLESRNIKADVFQLNYVLGRFAELNEKNIFLMIEPSWLSLGIVLLIFYLSHGYYGLSLCLQLPFNWTYGLGFSKAATDYLLQYFGVDIWQRHYLFINENINGWPSGMFWSTAFPWFASDITFIGVPILMYLLGRFLMKVLFDVVKSKNPYGFAVFWQLMILLIYLPANNQIFQSRQSFWGSILVFLLYFIKKDKEIGSKNKA